MSENTSLDAIFCRAIEIAEDKERAKKAAGEVSPPKQIPHRPGQAPALGLRARISIVPKFLSLSGDTLGLLTATGFVLGSIAEGSGVQAGDYGYGGAVYVAGGTVTLTNDYLQNNDAVETDYGSQGRGGGIFIASGATVYLDSFTFKNTTSNFPDNIEGGYILLS